MYWLVACSAPSQYLNQCWVIVKQYLRNKVQWNSNGNTTIFSHENAFEKVICEKVVILSRGRWDILCQRRSFILFYHTQVSSSAEACHRNGYRYEIHYLCMVGNLSSRELLNINYKYYLDNIHPHAMLTQSFIDRILFYIVCASEHVSHGCCVSHVNEIISFDEN